MRRWHWRPLARSSRSRDRSLVWARRPSKIADQSRPYSGKWYEARRIPGCQRRVSARCLEPRKRRLFWTDPIREFRGVVITDGTYRMLAWPSEAMVNSSSKICTPGNLARIFATCRSYTGKMTHPSRSGSDLPEARVAKSVMGRISDSKGPKMSSLARDTIAKRIRGCFQSLFCGSWCGRGGTA